MKTALEIFLMVGMPLPRQTARVHNFGGFRGFNEHDIKAIQDEAFKAGLKRAAAIADTYLQSMGSRDGMKVASLIKDEIISDSVHLDIARLKPEK